MIWMIKLKKKERFDGAEDEKKSKDGSTDGSVIQTTEDRWMTTMEG